MTFYKVKKIVHQVAVFWNKLMCEVLILACALKLLEPNGGVILHVLPAPLKIQTSVIERSTTGYLSVLNACFNNLTLLWSFV